MLGLLILLWIPLSALSIHISGENEWRISNDAVKALLEIGGNQLQFTTNEPRLFGPTEKHNRFLEITFGESDATLEVETIGYRNDKEYFALATLVGSIRYDSEAKTIGFQPTSVTVHEHSVNGRSTGDRLRGIAERLQRFKRISKGFAWAARKTDSAANRVIGGRVQWRLQKRRHHLGDSILAYAIATNVRDIRVERMNLVLDLKMWSALLALLGSAATGLILTSLYLRVR